MTVRGQFDGKPAWANQIEALFTGAGYSSQEKFARAIGMKRGRMGHIVAGYNEPIEAMSYEERVRMLRVLNLSAEEFIDIIANAYPSINTIYISLTASLTGVRI